jgi:hypothetical protein
MLEESAQETDQSACVTFSPITRKSFTMTLKTYKHVSTPNLLGGARGTLHRNLLDSRREPQRGDLNFSKLWYASTLCRVTTSNFHFVILDEAVSMFLHFNSKTHEKQLTNSWKLRLFIRQCQRATYFVDAALDTTFVYRQLLQKALNCKPHWIRNKYIRPVTGKRSLPHVINPMIVREDSLVASAIKQVQTLLERGTKWWCAIDEVLHRSCWMGHLGKHEGCTNAGVQQL